MLGIFDGHNGDQVSAFVALRLPAILSAKFGPHCFAGAVQQSNDKIPKEAPNEAEFENQEVNARIQQITEQLVCAAFEECDEELRKSASAESAVQGGSTAGFAFVTCNGWLVLASCGDCRLAVVGDDDSVLLRINTDHCPVSNSEENERLSRISCPIVGGRMHGKLGVSRAFGDFEFKPQDTMPQLRPLIPTPTVKMMNLRRNNSTGVKAVVIGCDGVWETQDLDTVSVAVAKEGAGAMSRMVQTCCATNQPLTPDNKQLLPGSDNISLAALFF